MKIPKWHEINPKDINIVWDCDKNGAFCLAVTYFLDGKISIGKMYYEKAKIINLTEIYDLIGKELSKLQKLEEKEILKDKE